MRFSLLGLSVLASLVSAGAVPRTAEGGAPAGGEKSTIFEGATVIAFDDANERLKVMPDTSVLVTGDRIAKIFPSSEKLDMDAERIPAAGKIITPGFIDTHRHGWQTAYKGMVSNTTLAAYFARYSAFSDASNIFKGEDTYVGQAFGMYEAINAGVTSVLDHAHGQFSNETAEGTFKASLESGARIWLCYGFGPVANGFTVDQQIANFKDLRADPRLEGSLVSIGMAYDNFYDGPSEDIQKLLELSKTADISALTTHFLGGLWGSANSPLLLNRLGFMDNSTTHPVVYSHATYITPQDVTLLREFNQYISITPESEMHYGHGNAFSQFVMDQGAIGVDTHSTYSTDIITQARIWLQTVRLRLFERVLANWKVPRNNPMSANQAFYLATRSGALALRRRDIGVIQEGAKADLVVFNGQSPNMVPHNRDPVGAVILHSNVGDIEHVMINGQWRKKDGALVVSEHQDRADIQARFVASAQRVQDFYDAKGPTELEGQFTPGIDFYTLQDMDVVRGAGTGY